jgi:hypothetical protein
VLSQLPRTHEAKLKAEGAAAYFEKWKLGEGPMGQSQLLEVLERTLRDARRSGARAARAGAAGRPG